jgi:hypothetical protein
MPTGVFGLSAGYEISLSSIFTDAHTVENGSVIRENDMAEAIRKTITRR